MSSPFGIDDLSELSRNDLLAWIFTHHFDIPNDSEEIQLIVEHSQKNPDFRVALSREIAVIDTALRSYMGNYSGNIAPQELFTQATNLANRLSFYKDALPPSMVMQERDLRDALGKIDPYE